MTKYGRGLSREVVAAVNTGELTEPLTIASVQALVHRRQWAVSDQVLNVALVNAASETHSHTTKKYFESIGRGQYRVRDAYRGLNWR